MTGMETGWAPSAQFSASSTVSANARQSLFAIATFSHFDLRSYCPGMMEKMALAFWQADTAV